MERVICLIIGYVFGLFQTGYIYGKLHHVDIRQYGSGNAGTTNAMRILGKKAGIITYLGDMLKAILASLTVHALFSGSHQDIMFLLTMYTGMGVVLGHNFPFYMGFRGGKGIAASSGVIFALFDWRLIVCMVVTFLVITAIWRYVSLGSICFMAGFFIELIVFGQLGFIRNLQQAERVETYIVGFCFSALAIYKHRSNIVRLLQGTERKLGEKKQESQQENQQENK